MEIGFKLKKQNAFYMTIVIDLTNFDFASLQLKSNKINS